MSKSASSLEVTTGKAKLFLQSLALAPPATSARPAAGAAHLLGADDRSQVGLEGAPPVGDGHAVVDRGQLLRL